MSWMGKEWHLQQLHRINQALEASHNKQHPLYPRKKVSWQQEIKKIFQTHNNLRPIEVIQLLVENGIVDAAVLNRKGNVYATMAQMTKDGILKKTQRGIYQKIFQE